MEQVVTKAQVLNQLTTPLIIFVTFGQTLSVVVDIDLKWPSFLLEIFSWFSFLTLKCAHCWTSCAFSCGQLTEPLCVLLASSLAGRNAALNGASVLLCPVDTQCTVTDSF